MARRLRKKENRGNYETPAVDQPVMITATATEPNGELKQLEDVWETQCLYWCHSSYVGEDFEADSQWVVSKDTSMFSMHR